MQTVPKKHLDRFLRADLYFILLASLGLFFFLGRFHLFDWDEINFAEAAREMLVTGNFSQVQIDFRPFMEKPPLFFWLQALSMTLLGVTESAARLPNAICGLLTILSLIWAGRNYKDLGFGILWASCFLGSFLPHLYFKSGIIDPFFNLFIFLSLVFFSKSKINFFTWMLSGISLGTAVLFKGPVAVLLFSLTTLLYFFLNRIKVKECLKKAYSNEVKLGFTLFLVSLVLISSIWFVSDLIKNGFVFLPKFFKYQIRLLTTGDAGHDGPIFFHFLTLLIGCFPASVLAIFEMRNKTSKQNTLRTLMLGLLFTVLFVFSLVRTKIIHYSSLAYFPLTFFAAEFIYKNNIQSLSSRLRVFLSSVGLIWAFILLGIPFLLWNKQNLVGIITNPYVKGMIEAQVSWGYADFFAGIVFLMGLAALYMSQLNPLLRIRLLLICTYFSVLICYFQILPKIEEHLQGSLIRFYQAHQTENVYFEPLDHKSYAHLFYTKAHPGKLHTLKKDSVQRRLWLLYDKIDKPVYFASKLTGMDEYKNFAQLQFLKEENGFAYFKREPN